MTGEAVPGVLRIGDLRVDPSLDEICKQGVVIKVEPRAMRLLLCLAEHPGQVVSVEALLDRVWKEVVVSPDSVYAAVAGLRRTLGDDPKEPVYIANVMRRGYRLVAPVSPWVDSPEAPSQTAPIPLSPLESAAPQAPPRTTGPTAPNAASDASARLISRRRLLIVVAAVLAVIGSSYMARRLHSRIVGAPDASERSVAVLPFVDMSEKKDQEYFGDGMSEELIDLLTRLPGLSVPARTSSFYFKSKQATVPEIARALGVNYVLEGSVRKSGDTLRITAHLVRADTGYDTWSETFDRPMADVFKIQDEIAGEVVRALKVSLLPAAARGAPTDNTAAYALFLKARALMHSGWSANFDLAIGNLQQALVLDPNFAAGWATLSRALVADINMLDSSQYLAHCEDARKAAAEAIRLNDKLPDGHRAMGLVAGTCDWDWSVAETELKRALDLVPDDADTLRAYAEIAWLTSRGDLELALAQRAVARDPLSDSSLSTLAMAQSATGRYREAVDTWRKVVAMAQPAASGPHALLTNALLMIGEPAAALDEIQREPDPQSRAMNMPFIYAALGRKREAYEALSLFIKDYAAKEPLTVGEFYACQGEIEPAITWMQRALAQHEAIMDVPNRAACFKSVEHDPRYLEMRHTMHLD